MSSVSVNLEPAEFSNWQEARTSLMAEAKTGLKAKLEAELASMADESQLEGLREQFSKEERALEHNMDHQVHTFSAILDLEYKYTASIQTLCLAQSVSYACPLVCAASCPSRWKTSTTRCFETAPNPLTRGSCNNRLNALCVIVRVVARSCFGIKYS